MVWIFERDGEKFELKSYYDKPHREFVLIIYPAGERRRIERFKAASAFRHRLAALEQQLTAEKWTQHGPTVLHDAWQL